ncbi:uncharacterized protein EDB91DRAFT_320404 [Suillus paluster]|uniref:uncharacterized protein n=1 Tax=Suillus paluster TaxID=48578 RepID=UPI001B861E9D|nr:uncharacterized protein EDB91DRAFT_320404 [Suillus paluster]KAG1741912.1 hypothetical protein EDB91DRAFT_320404 [Suillus paluster]
MSGNCDSLNANMHARSLFGEDASANLTIEKTEAGIVDIRSKTQCISYVSFFKTAFGVEVHWIQGGIVAQTDGKHAGTDRSSNFASQQM